MVRLYLCTVIGSGREGDPFRPALDAVPGLSWGADDGRPDETKAAGWMLVRADVTDAQHAAVVAIPGVTHVDPARSAEAKMALEREGIETASLGSAKVTVPQLVAHVVTQIRAVRALQTRDASGRVREG